MMQEIYKQTSEIFQAKLNERAEVTTGGYLVTGDFLQCIGSVLVAKNRQKFQSRCLVDTSSLLVLCQYLV